MIKFENGVFEGSGPLHGLLTDLTMTIQAVRQALEAHEIPDEAIIEILSYCYTLGAMQYDDLLEYSKTHDPREVLKKWEQKDLH